MTFESTYSTPLKVHILHVWKICSQAEDLGMNLWYFRSDILPSSISSVLGIVGGVSGAADSAGGLLGNVTFLRMPGGRHAYFRAALAHGEGSWLLSTCFLEVMYAAIIVPTMPIKAATRVPRVPTIGAQVAAPLLGGPAKHSCSERTTRPASNACH